MGYLGGFRVTFRQRGKKQRVTREYAKNTDFPSVDRCHRAVTQAF